MLPTPGRIVLLQDGGDRVPAIVVRAHEHDATVTLVAFSDEWPITAARVFRHVPELDSRDDSRTGPRWVWPRRRPHQSLGAMPRDRRQ